MSDWFDDPSQDAVTIRCAETGEILDGNKKTLQILGLTSNELKNSPFRSVNSSEQTELLRFLKKIPSQSGNLEEISSEQFDSGKRKYFLSVIRSPKDAQASQSPSERESAFQKIRNGAHALIGESRSLQQVMNQIYMVAPTDSTVLICGESGTGKERVAHALHSLSRRKKKRFVRVNCASIPNELFESEFFGHVRGAFTGALKDREGRFQAAHEGTLFLDEVGELPLQVQGKLLRVLQEGQFERVGEDQTRSVDVRVIAATNRDLYQEVQKGNFRQDLYYRLNIFPISIPPLRERVSDLRPLAEYFLKQASQRMGIPTPPLLSSDVRFLQEQPWPGNVRELQNTLERALILSPSRGGRLSFDSAFNPPAPLSASTSFSGPPSFLKSLPDSETTPRSPLKTVLSQISLQGLTFSDLELLERRLIQETLHRCDGRIYGKNGAANQLGIKPTTLASRLQKMGLRPK